jgi:hypothetical protein
MAGVRRLLDHLVVFRAARGQAAGGAAPKRRIAGRWKPPWPPDSGWAILQPMLGAPDDRPAFLASAPPRGDDQACAPRVPAPTDGLRRTPADERVLVGQLAPAIARLATLVARLAAPSLRFAVSFVKDRRWPGSSRTPGSRRSSTRGKGRASLDLALPHRRQRSEDAPRAGGRAFRSPRCPTPAPTTSRRSAWTGSSAAWKEPPGPWSEEPRRLAQGVETRAIIERPSRTCPGPARGHHPAGHRQAGDGRNL